LRHWQWHSKALLALGLLAFLYFVWPTLWEYETMGDSNLPIRINRLTGRVYVFVPQNMVGKPSEWRSFDRLYEERSNPFVAAQRQSTLGRLGYGKPDVAPSDDTDDSRGTVEDAVEVWRHEQGQ
jgi:hypothetical protein